MFGFSSEGCTFIAKLSDYTYIVTLMFYVIGYVTAASSTSIFAYVTGEVFVANGSSGLDLTNDIIVADLTPLEWRGFVSSMLSTPLIINTWFADKIVDAMQARNQWRWGYGRFAIMPAALGPAIGTLLWLDKKARRTRVANLASSNAASRAVRDLSGEQGYDGPHGATISPAAKVKNTWTQGLKRNLIEIDALGLVLLGFAWSLLLLPFSLKTSADNGWLIPSLIAMMVVGGVLLIAYVVYETRWAQVPSAPRCLIMNKTFMMAIIIESFYMLAGNIRGLYWSSYVYIAKPWSSQEWVYYNNTDARSMRIRACRWIVAKIVGLCVKIIGMGIMLDGPRATISTAPMTSVPHQDVALAIALLSLWSKIGSSIGSAVFAVIWAEKIPKLLRQYLPENATDKDVKGLFDSVRTIRTKYTFDDPMRQGAIEAYRRTLYYCLVPALALAFVPLIAALFQTNFHLGKQQNAVTNVGNDGQMLREKDRNPEPTLPPKD
ncbi:Siderophore iron transporter 3 [Colletotrichum spinosum]|uniref:Siderophore iron transporter 3 n=1 Tax=Colletotrichum spinosum TaxID=1347390 RepID=A0A4R8Q410_9PEZI|nr:Siderophore iron transporter 3 [Colletotrichum spinosum]